MHGLRAIGREHGVLGGGGLHPHLEALHVLDLPDLALGIHVAQAQRRERDDPRALHRLGDHRLDRRRHLRVRQRFRKMGFRAEQEMQRHHTGLRRKRRRIGGGGNAELDVAGFHQLQHLRLLPELCARILVDQHGALAELLEPVAEGVADNAVAGAFRLIVGEAEAANVLRPGDPWRRKRYRAGRQYGNGVPSGNAHSQPSLMCPLVFVVVADDCFASVTSLSCAGKALCESAAYCVPAFGRRVTALQREPLASGVTLPLSCRDDADDPARDRRPHHRRRARSPVHPS